MDPRDFLEVAKNYHGAARLPNAGRWFAGGRMNEGFT
jgi:hypothetical protein